MLRTIALLLITIVIAPILAFNFSPPLSDVQWIILQKVSILACGVALYCFIVSELTKNYSQTDKIWSTAPILYAWYIYWLSDAEPRLMLMAVLVTIWGIRLTLNFARKGGYSWRFWEGEEDYRWAILRQKPFLQSTWSWRLFNFFFIAFYQNALILAFTLPMVAAAGNAQISLNALDWGLAGIFIFFVVYETIADNQQWAFQSEKYRRIAANAPLDGDYQKGFLTKGLWAFSRHPNYFAEQMVWIVFYIMSIQPSGNWINWSIMGSMLLVLLFANSADFSEDISSQNVKPVPWCNG